MNTPPLPLAVLSAVLLLLIVLTSRHLVISMAEQEAIKLRTRELEEKIKMTELHADEVEEKWRQTIKEGFNEVARAQRDAVEEIASVASMQHQNTLNKLASSLTEAKEAMTKLDDTLDPLCRVDRGLPIGQNHLTAADIVVVVPLFQNDAGTKDAILDSWGEFFPNLEFAVYSDKVKSPTILNGWDEGKARWSKTSLIPAISPFSDAHSNKAFFMVTYWNWALETHPRAKWFFKVEPETFVFSNNIVRLLTSHDFRKEELLCALRWPHCSGGAGCAYFFFKKPHILDIFSRPMLERIHPELERLLTPQAWGSESTYEDKLLSDLVGVDSITNTPGLYYGTPWQRLQDSTQFGGIENPLLTFYNIATDSLRQMRAIVETASCNTF